MTKNHIIIALSVALVMTLVLTLGTRSPSDRVEEKCMMGDMVFLTADGGTGIVPDVPKCAHTRP